jgi:glycosyltransferase involved in cell wall biosynthesis
MTKSAKKITTSIIIPCFKETRWLSDAINSALSQTADNQIIVVDDGNPNDLVEQICKKFSNENILYVRTEHVGSSAARNIGLQYAEGNFIKFLDADDLLYPESLIKQEVALRNSNCDVIYGDWCYEKITFKFFKLREDTLVSCNDSELLIALLKKYWITPGALLYKKETLLRLGSWDEQFTVNDDFVFNVKLLVQGAKFSYQPGPSLVYRRHSRYTLSSSVTISKKSMFKYVQAVKATLDFIKSEIKNYQSLELQEALNWHYLWLANQWYEFDRTTALELKAQSTNYTKLRDTNYYFDWIKLENTFPASILQLACRLTRSIARKINLLRHHFFIDDLIETTLFCKNLAIKKIKLLLRHVH